MVITMVMIYSSFTFHANSVCDLVMKIRLPDYTVKISLFCVIIFGGFKEGDLFHLSSF